MGKVLAFRKTGEGCKNCWYYFPHEKHTANEGARGGYCRHPDFMKVSGLDRAGMRQPDLRRDPGQWCPKYVSVDSPEMKKLQTLSGVKFSLLCLKKRPEYSVIELVSSNEYRELADFFFQENKKLVTVNQYKAIKRDVDYFTALVDKVSEYYLRKSKSRRHLSYMT